MNYQQLDKKIAKLVKYKKNFDVDRREVGNQQKFIIYFLSSLSDDYSIEKLIESVLIIKENQSIESVVYTGSIKRVEKTLEMATIILSGQALIIPMTDQIEYCHYVDVRKYPNRGIEEPETEKSIRGAKDGFNENFITTIALIRRRLKSVDLRLDAYEIGKQTNTYVALVYLDNVVNRKVLEIIKQRLEEAKKNLISLVMSDKALQEVIFKQKYCLYPLVRYTERPDIAAIQILKGHIAIVVDTSSSVIITPTTIFDHLTHVEEFRQVPIVGLFTRLIRFFANLLAIFIIPVWLIFINNQHLSIFFYATPIISNYPIFIIQILMVEIMIEVLRIATVHTPSKLSSAMGLVSALILGQVAVEIGLFIPEILLYCSISAIGGFATPSYELSMANKVVKIFLIILTAIFGIYGLIFGVLVNIIYLARIKVLGVPYLSPLLPFNFKRFKNFVFLKKNKKIR